MTIHATPPTRLVGAIRSLLNRFRDELSGPRQATRTQLVQFLARELKINEQAACRLFDDLQIAGVIARRDEQLDENGLSHDEGQQWAIDADNQSDAVTGLEPTIQIGLTEGSESNAVELLRRAIRSRATDVHFDPFGDEVEIRFRIDGRLEHYCRLSAAVGRQIMSQLKVLANLDPVDPFHAHEGRLALPIGLSEYDVRITTTPVALGEAVALRLLHRDQIIRPLATLGLSNAGLEQINEALRSGEGLVLVIGPSGAGKTTTLYSLVHHLDDGHRNIMTIEDPVEYLVPQFLQIPVDLRHGRSLASGLKTVLRMDADIVLLGEVRDAETTAATMRAASCGKHIFTTLHARDAAAAVTALRDLNVDNRSLAGSVRAIIAQRLVRRSCSECHGTRAPSEDETRLFDAEGIRLPECLPTVTGCDGCRGTGYCDRVGVFEISLISADVSAAIASGKGEHHLRQLMRTCGAVNLMADGLRKVAEGLTTLEEVRAMSWMTFIP